MPTFRVSRLRGLSLVLSCVLGLCVPGAARHIIGGEITYECLGPEADGSGQRYVLRFEIYRDALGEGAALDSDAGSLSDFQFAIYDGTTLIDEYVIRRDGLLKESITPDDNPCVIEPPDLLTDRGFYEIEVVLPVIPRPYTVTYQRCCRNERIDNIVNPGEAGATYFIDISPAAQQVCNSSPRFSNFPPIFTCDNIDLAFDHVAVDADGDELRYSLCEPVDGGGVLGSQQGDPPGSENSPRGVTPNPETPPPYAPNPYREPQFTYLDPIPGDRVLNLDPQSGLLSIVPSTPGNYVLCVSVEEYRDGELLSVVRRDFQVNVIECETIVRAGVTASGTVGAETASEAEVQFVQFCGSRDGTVFDRSEGGSALSGIEWRFEGTVDGTVESTDTVVGLEFPGYGIYDGRLIAKTELDCNDTLEFELRVTPPTRARLRMSFDSCVYGPVEFRDESFTEAQRIERVNWDFGGPEPVPNQRLQSVLFERAGVQHVDLEVVDNNECRSLDSITFEYYPIPARLPASLVAAGDCVPAEAQYEFDAPFVTDDYAFAWDFGDGGTSRERDPSHAYRAPGIFTTYLSLTSPHDCFGDVTLDTPVEALESPVAAFDVTPDAIDVRDPTVRIGDRSVAASSWRYDLGVAGESREREPEVTFPGMGTYEVEQAVTHVNGCVDTARLSLTVDPYVSYRLPNAFTPNGDGDNERFRGVGFVELITDFRMRIFARWGELIFETDDSALGWDGTIARNGEPAQPGVYLYVVDYDSPEGPVQLEGFVTLVR